MVFLSHNQMFEAMNWRVIPFSMRHPKNIQSDWSEYFIDEIEYGSNYSVLEKIKRVPKTIYSLEARSQLNKLIANNQFDICHVHNIYHHISPSIFSLLKKKQIPVVMTLHDLKIACPAYSMLAKDGICERCKQNKIYNVLIQRCIKNSVLLSGVVMVESMLHKMLGTYHQYVDKFVVPSKFYIEKLVEWGWDRQRFIHIPNFVDLKSFQPEYTPGDYFLYFGRLSREKGLVTLIKSACKAGVPLKIVGTGPDDEALKKLVQASDANNIEFLGYLTGDPLHSVIRSALAVILPSEWYENAPVSLMESYALGKPVIGAEIGGIPELIKQDICGSVFKSGSFDELTSLLQKYAALPGEQVTEMGRAGRAWMEDDFSLEQYQSRILSLYRDLGAAQE